MVAGGVATFVMSRAALDSLRLYPIPLHRQKAFADVFADVKLPVTEDVTARCLSLPIYPEMSDTQIVSVTDVIRTALG